MTNFDVIFDNGGGVTLQTETYAHHFSEGAECAAVVADLLDGSDPAYWEGNEHDQRLEYDIQTEQNGGYRWVTDNDILQAVGELEAEERAEYLERLGWINQTEFYNRLFELQDNKALQQ